jgi:hypothetical protein
MSNQPVFPIADLNEHPGPCGLTIRDYFAAKAIRAQPTFPRSLWQLIRCAFGCTYTASRFSPEDYARDAYEQADAMLKAREA